MNSFSRGSEWRKWDLHVHTKNTNKNDQFISPDFNTFCETLFKKALLKEISVIGITDYFSIDNYKKIIEFRENLNLNTFFSEDEKRKIHDIFILPNIELRMLPVTDSGKLINIHCLFNPSFVSNLENDFFNKLMHKSHSKSFLMNYKSIVDLGKQVDNTITDDSLAYKKGIDNFAVSYSDLKEILSTNSDLRNNSIIVVSNSSRDGNSGLQKHYDLFENEADSCLDDVRRSIYHLSNCIFSSNLHDRDYFLGKKADNAAEVTRKCGSLKPCIHGSDAHTEDKLFCPDNNKYCWIKADPTFEGLKQIIYEPEYRVIIQESKPEDKAGYYVIGKITLKEQGFWQEEILFNQNLNTIIGGRSTGKSTLLHGLAKKIDSKADIENSKEADSSTTTFIDSHLSGISIIWSDGETEQKREIDFFKQGYMHDIASNLGEFNKLILGIIKKKDENNLLSKYDSFCSGNKIKISAWVNELFMIQENLNSKTNELKDKGDQQGINSEIKKLAAKIAKFNSESKISPAELQKYDDYLEKIRQKEEKIKQLENDSTLLLNLSTKAIYNDLTYDFATLSEMKDNITEKFKQLTVDFQKRWEQIVINENEACCVKISKTRERVKAIKELDVFKKGELHYLSNKELSELQVKLDNEKKKLSEITEIEKQISIFNEQSSKLKKQILEAHKNYKTQLLCLISNLTFTYEGLKISTKEYFDEDKLSSFLKARHNRRSNDNKDYYTNISKNYSTNMENIISEYLNYSLQGNIEYIAGYQANNVSNEFLSTNWLDFIFDLEYENDSFNTMSQGKKSFVVLKLLLEFSEKQCPILIDQPEDSLDNRAIYNELVKYLKEKKKTRQIILVTHNPNVVVSADSEQVIIANQHGNNSPNPNGNKFHYIAGSLENTKQKNIAIKTILESQGIREHVCEILEGGKEAFEKREQKYGFS